MVQEKQRGEVKGRMDVEKVLMTVRLITLLLAISYR